MIAGMENTGHQMICYDLAHPVRDASIGRTNQPRRPHGFRHPVRDASLTGCKGHIWISVSTERPSLTGCMVRVVFSTFLSIDGGGIRGIIPAVI